MNELKAEMAKARYKLNVYKWLSVTLTSTFAPLRRCLDSGEDLSLSPPPSSIT